MVDDGHGGIQAINVIINVTGTSIPVAPVISVGPADSTSATLSEGAGQAIPLSAFGTLTATDANSLDVLTASITGVEISGNAASIAASDVLGLLSVTNGQLGRFQGNLFWAFQGNSALFDYLLPGEQVTLAYTISVNDGKGGTDTELVTVVITGANENPVISLSGGDKGSLFINEDGSVFGSGDPTPLVSHSGTLTVTDLDSSGALTVTVTGVNFDSNVMVPGWSPMDWFTISFDPNQNASNLTWTFTADPALFDQLRGNQATGLFYTVQISDGQGGIITRVIDVIVVGQNDPLVRVFAQNDSVSAQVTEDNAAASGSFAVYDPDMQDITFVAPASPLIQVSGNLGGLTLGDLANFASAQQAQPTFPLGTKTVGWSFTPPEGAFDYLAEGEQVTITYNLAVYDGQLAGIIQPFTITITGAADLV